MGMMNPMALWREWRQHRRAVLIARLLVVAYEAYHEDPADDKILLGLAESFTAYIDGDANRWREFCAAPLRTMHVFMQHHYGRGL